MHFFTFFSVKYIDTGDYLETKDYSQTDLEIISVNEIDGESPVENKEKNIIREKTFNNELHSLVNQIYLNEEMNDKQLNFDEISSSEMNALLMRCESLIYRIKHFDSMPVISSSCNPFEMESVDDNTIDIVTDGLAQCGFTRYQILQYSFSDKAYKSSVNNLDPYFADTVFFSINETIILYINDNIEGIIIKPDLIHSNPFFRKKFISGDDNISDISSFYIVKISSIFDGLMDSGILEKSINTFEQFFSPLLLIELKPGESFQAKEIFNKLKEFTSFSFLSYFFKNCIKSRISDYSFEEILLIIDSFTKLNSSFRLTTYVITLNDYSIKENIFILKFVISKIKRLLQKESLIFRVSINKIILIIPESNINHIRNIIDKVNSSEEVIKMQIINSDYINNKELLDFLLS